MRGRGIGTRSSGLHRSQSFRESVNAHLWKHKAHACDVQAVGAAGQPRNGEGAIGKKERAALHSTVGCQQDSRAGYRGRLLGQEDPAGEGAACSLIICALPACTVQVACFIRFSFCWIQPALASKAHMSVGRTGCALTHREKGCSLDTALVRRLSATALAGPAARHAELSGRSITAFL